MTQFRAVQAVSPSVNISLPWRIGCTMMRMTMTDFDQAPDFCTLCVRVFGLVGAVKGRKKIVHPATTGLVNVRPSCIYVCSTAGRDGSLYNPGSPAMSCSLRNLILAVPLDRVACPKHALQ